MLTLPGREHFPPVRPALSLLSLSLPVLLPPLGYDEAEQ